jgi:hypothetical protein
MRFEHVSPLAKRQDLLAAAVALCRTSAVVGRASYNVKTAAELRGVLKEAAGSSHFAIIEVSIGPRDLSTSTMNIFARRQKKRR